MYAKVQSTNKDNICKIPVETYENRDIIGALARKNAENALNFAQEKNESSKCQINHNDYHDIPQNHSCNNNQKICKKDKNCFFDKISGDDLLLIGIILLLIFDGNNDCDFLIPILIAIILLN